MICMFITAVNALAARLPIPPAAAVNFRFFGNRFTGKISVINGDVIIIFAGRFNGQILDFFVFINVLAAVVCGSAFYTAILTMIQKEIMSAIERTRASVRICCGWLRA